MLIQDDALRSVIARTLRVIEEELNEIMQYIEYLNSILADEMKLLGVIKEELREIKSKYNDERRTEIQKVVNEIDIEDLIQEEDVVITLTNSGYIKRISADTYSAQRRGGRGIQAMTTKEDDFVENVLITSTHSDVLFFTKIRLPEIVDQALSSVGSMIGPASMIVTGMLIAEMNLRNIFENVKVYFISFLRLVVIPVISLAILKISGLVNIHPDGKKLLLIVFLAVITPSASTITQMCQVYGNDSKYASAINVMTTLLSIITMPLMVLQYQTMM